MNIRLKQSICSICSRREGVTLVEVVVSFFILTVAILGTVSVLMSSVKLGQENNLRTMAIFGAMQKLDEVLLSEDDLSIQDGQVFPIEGLQVRTSANTFSENVGLIKVKRINEENTDPNDDMVVVKVVVTWTPLGTESTPSLELEAMVFAP